MALSFALWTVICNAVILSRGSLRDLMRAEAAGFLAALFLVALAFVVLRARRSRPAPAEQPSAVEEPEPRPPFPAALPRPVLALRGAAAALTAAALVAFPMLSRIELFWWIAVAVLLLGALSLIFEREPLAVPRPRRSRAWEAMLWALALAALVFNLFVHRPDPDDSLYLNLAARAADAPDEAFMIEDRMHGIEGLAFHAPVYLTNSIEPFWGMLSWLTGIDAQIWFHVAQAGLGAILIVLAYAVLFRLLLPGRWLLGVAVLLLILIGAGGPQNHWYGNLAFVRVWQGKCTFLHVFLPLTFAWSMRFAMRPSLYGWLLLTSAQIAALGMSSSSIWVEPLASGLGLICGAIGPDFPGRLRGWIRLLAGCGASLYTLALGLHLKNLMRASAEKIRQDRFKLRNYETNIGFQEVLDTTGQALDWGLRNVMGNGPLLYLCLAALLISWAVSRQVLARRLAIFVPLLGLLFIMNPYIEKLVMANVTGPVFYRATWLLPIPVFLTLLFLSPLELDPKRVPRRMVVFLLIVALAGYVFRASEFPTWDRRNRIYYGAPGVKIEPEILQSLRQTMSLLPSGAHVIAPVQLSFWFPTFHRPVYPVTVNRWYTYVRGRELTREEADWRIALTDYVSGEKRPEDYPARFREGLDHFGIQGVVVDGYAVWREELEQVLAEARFTPVPPAEPGVESRYRLWIRPADDPAVLGAAPWQVVALRS